MYEQSFPVSDTILKEVLDFVEVVVHEKAEWCKLVRLVVEELVLNILQHGSPRQGAEIKLSLSLADPIQICLIDDGPPFDPTLPQHQIFSPDQVGGRGLSLVSHLVDAWVYTRESDQNIVHIYLKQSG